MTERETSSCLPDQKKEKAKEESSFATQAGMWTRGHIPHPREGKSIYNQGFATKRQRTRMPRFENMIHRFNTGTPVINIQIPSTNENTQNLNFTRRPLEGDWRVGATTPSPQPKALGFSLVLAGRTSDTRTYRRGDKGQPCLTPRERSKKPEI